METTKEAIKAKLFLSELLTFSTTAEEEHDSYIEAAEDTDMKQEFIDSVQDNLEQDYVWGWCCVKQTANFCGLEGVNYLGHCSYKGVIDFKDNSGYYEQMKEDALKELVDNIYELTQGLGL